MEIRDLPALNATLNAIAAILLGLGLHRIRRGRETAHKRFMLAAFACSVLFLACYLWYHSHAGRIAFAGTGLARTAYLALLLSHTVLAALVPLLAASTIFLGLTDRRRSHRRLARVTFPIWLYVSVTGVLIYLVLYHLTDSARLALGSG